MNPIFAAASEIEAACTEQRWRFCFIGGLAVLRWGEPRLTRDVDLTVLAGYGQEARFVDPLLDRFRPRLETARQFALKHRVVLIKASNDVPIDVALGGLPFEERSIERASPFPIGNGKTLRTCSAEDLIVHKVFAGRDGDWLDVEGVILRQGEALDEALIIDELRPLLALKEAPENLDRLNALLRRAT